jgi:hypothetical protein
MPLLLTVLALAAVVGSTDVDTVVPESTPFLDANKDQAGAAEFMADSSFWSAVDSIQDDLQSSNEASELAEAPKAVKQPAKPPKEEKEVVTFDDSETPTEKKQKQPIIEVAKKDMKMVGTVVKTTSKQQKQADDECARAKKQASDHAAQSSKKKRHLAMKAVEKYCNKVTGDVQAEEEEAVTDITGTKNIEKGQTQKDAANKEKALFKKDLGADVPITGDAAEKMGKDQADAKALKTMADKQVSTDQKLAVTACAKAHTMAAKAGGNKTKKGRELLKKAHKYCKTLSHVIVKEGQSIAKDVKATAQGKEDVRDSAGPLSKGVTSEEAVRLQHQAEQACDDAKDQVEKQLQGVPPAQQDALREKAMGLAKTLCEKVKAQVKEAINQDASVVQKKAGDVVVGCRLQR